MQNLLDSRAVRRQERSAGGGNHRQLPDGDRYGLSNAGGRGGRGGGGGRGGAALNGPPYKVVKFRTTPACPAAPNVTVGMEFTNSLLQGEKVDGAQAFTATETNAKLDSFELNSVKKLTLHLACTARRVTPKT